MRKKMLMELKPLKVMSRYIADAKESEKSLIKEKRRKRKISNVLSGSNRKRNFKSKPV